MITVSFPVNAEALMREVFEQVAQRAVAALPQPDPMYTVPEVAELLHLDKDTVRRYLTLPAGHPRRLRYVRTSESAHGNRVRLSDLTTWQERNLAQLPGEVAPRLIRSAKRRSS